MSNYEKNTEYVFRGTTTYCAIHKPEFEGNQKLSRKILNKERVNILKVKSGEIKE